MPLFNLSPTGELSTTHREDRVSEPRLMEKVLDE